MKYILDMPMVGGAGGLSSYQNSANKKDDINAMLFGTGNSSKVLNQINSNLPPKQSSFHE
jgi:hypothetical protein